MADEALDVTDTSAKLTRRDTLLRGTFLAATAMSGSAFADVAQAQAPEPAPAAPASAAPGSALPNILVMFGDDIGQTNLSTYSFGLMG
jgi:hypothetical protein